MDVNGLPTVDDCLVAIGNTLGTLKINSVARMNKAVVIFYADTFLVEESVASGLNINNV